MPRIGQIVATALALVALCGCLGRAATTTASPSSTPSTPAAPAAADATLAASATVPSVAPTVPRAGRTAATAVATAVPVATVAPRTLPTAEAASRNLWDAWRDDDRPRALLAASAEAAKSLFAQPWGPEVLDQGCVPVDATTVRCGYALQTTAKLVTVVGTPANGYRATRVDDGAPLMAADLTRAGVGVDVGVGVSSSTTPSTPTAPTTPTTPSIAGTATGPAAGSTAIPGATTGPIHAAPTVPGGRVARPRVVRRKVVSRARSTLKGRTGASSGASGGATGGASPTIAITPVGAGPNTTPSGRVVVRQPVTQVKDGNNP